MRIAFIDPANWNYTPATPYQRPLGGSQSAICYLSAELAKLGHAITIFNGAEASAGDGVDIRNLRDANASRLGGYDVVVVGNCSIGKQLRRDKGLENPLILWSQHSFDEPGVAPLESLIERKCWTAFALVSDWQQQMYELALRVPPRRCKVMRNAVSPAFLDVPQRPPWFETGEPPVLVYISTPFRGLDVLLRAFPAIRAAVPGARLRVFSSMGVYGVKPEDDQHTALYQQARETVGVEYVGSIGQRALAEEINGAAALAYPSTFQETSCISVMEAMAVGAAVLSTRLAAIPETTAGHADLVEWQEDKVALARSFAAMAIETLRGMQQAPGSAEQRRQARIRYVRENCTWPLRAREWAAWLMHVRREQA